MDPMAGAVPPGGTPPPVNAREQVNVPAILLMVTGIVGILWALYHFATRGSSQAALEQALQQNPDAEKARPIFEAAMKFSSAGSIIAILTSALVIYAALQMRQLRNWPLAMAGAIIAMIPCFGPCCCIGLPVGIWALVVLNKPEIRAAYT